MHVNIKTQVNFCWHRAWLSMSTLRSKSFSVDIELSLLSEFVSTYIKRNFCVDLLIFDLYNSTHSPLVFQKWLMFANPVEPCFFRLTSLPGNYSILNTIWNVSPIMRKINLHFLQRSFKNWTNCNNCNICVGQSGNRQTEWLSEANALYILNFCMWLAFYTCIST